MQGRFLLLLSLLCLCLELALLALWTRSYWRIDQVTWIGGEGGWRVVSLAGTLHCGRASRLMHRRGLHWEVSPMLTMTTDWAWLYPGVNQDRRCLGFAIAEGNYDLHVAWVPYRVLVIPDWSLALPPVVVPAIWLSRVIRQRRRRIAGLCPTCGYDLRASSDQCSECGTPIPGRVPTALPPRTTRS